ncbi:zinc-dependent alcohol dehydrogenase [Paenibacillus montanisoli]|uniref:Chlorophyll synthesis pathway protein BchC n=1 Tax=Paenibacillus montanisoli TaxID=2081970 RepID=A0A328U6Z2_9BACL|nr:zinc-binding alcohol dehydrogenase [Paenibacillus montanisoli]RAP77171.1 chlorophyll synthesis pathway protein BchC [Paenibacillus montanisoli]
MQSMNIVFSAAQQVEVRVEELPALKPGEVRCKARKSLISTGTETLCLRGIFDSNTNWESWVQYPFNPGYSMAAEVIEVGEGVEHLKAGDRVTSNMSHKQYFNTDANNAKLIPDGITYEQASWLTLAQITQVGTRRAELKLGETVAIVGQGLLGQLVVQYMRAAGARQIIVIDQAESRLEFSRRSGATHTICAPVDAALEEVRRITGGSMCDVVYDITGHPAVLAPATLLAKEMGRVVLLGDTTQPSKQVIGPRVVSNSVAILGIHASMTRNYNGVTGDQMTAVFYDYLLQGRMNVDLLQTHTFSPLDAPAAYDFLVKDRTSAIGVIFDWDAL